MDINQWNTYYHFAKLYYKKNGNLLIPPSYEVNGYTLGKWIIHLKQEFKNGRLTPYQIKDLNNIGMVWEVYTFGINHFYELAKEYYRINGNLNIPAVYEINGQKIGNWIRSMRANFKNNILPVEYVKILSSIGMIWDYKQIKLMNRIRNQINVSSKDELLTIIENMVNCYLEDNLTSIMTYYTNDINLADLKKKVKTINETMKQLLLITPYHIIGLYICGFEIKEIAQIYKITPMEVEKIRLKATNLFLRNLTINDNKVLKKH